MMLKIKSLSLIFLAAILFCLSGCAAVQSTATNKSAAKPDYMVLKLQHQLSGTGITVRRIGQTNTFQLTMPTAISFGKNSSVLLPKFYASLDKVATLLKKYPQLLAKISGHTDIYGTLRYNQLLSEKRANNIARYLATKGIAQNRLQTAGYGITNPKASNKTPAGREKNRRVEILLYT